MEFMRRAKGSISIFLCIILMPMVTYSTMIIDASRMQVARTNIATAGDLAMNAALSEYEKVLQDMYGLFSVAQSEGDFEEQLKVYFTESLEGKFYSAEKDSKKYVEKGAELITGAATKEKPADKIENLTNLLLMSADELDYQTVPGSTLANQAIMKRQIIEYMKYKGPVSLATTLLPKLDFLKDSSKQTEVVKKKVEYTKTLDSLQDPCEEAWFKIVGVKNESGGYSVKGHQQLLDDFKNLELKDSIILYMRGFDPEDEIYTNKEGAMLGSDSREGHELHNGLMTRTIFYCSRASEAILLHANSKVTNAKTPKLEWVAPQTKTIEYEAASGDDEGTLKKYLDDTYGKFLSEITKTQGPFDGKMTIDVNSLPENYEEGGVNVVIAGDFISKISTINQNFANKIKNQNGQPLSFYNDIRLDRLRDYFLYQNDIRTQVEKEIDAQKFQNVLIAKKNAEEIKVKYDAALDVLDDKLTPLEIAMKDAEIKSNDAYTAWEKASKAEENAKTVLRDFKEEDTREEILSKLSGDDDNLLEAYDVLYKFELEEGATKTDVLDAYATETSTKYDGYDTAYDNYSKAVGEYNAAVVNLQTFYWQQAVMYDVINHTFWGEYEEKGKKLFSYVSPLEGEGFESYFLDYASEIAFWEPCKGWKDYCTALENVSKNCGEILTALGKVEAAIVKTNEAKAAWSGSIDGLSEGATKSSMKSDMDSTTDSLSLEEVQTFTVRVKTIKESVDKRINEVIKAAKFFNQPILEHLSSTDIYKSEKGKELFINYNFNDDEVINKIRNKANEIGNANCNFDDIFNDEDDDTYNDIVYLVEAIDGDPKDSEKFFDTLKSICETKKPEMTTEQQTQIDNINDSAQGNKPDDSGNSPTSPAHEAEPTENPKDQEYSDEVKAIDIGAIYTEIKGVASENGFPDPTEDPNNTGEPSVNGMKIDTDKSKYNDKDDKKGKASEGQDSLDAGTSILSSIADLGGKIVDCAYLEEYFTEMFTCRTDRESNGDIILLNGYAIPAPGEASLRTVNRNTPWFGKEIEYIIWGDSNLERNWAKTDALIYTIRFALNAIYAFTAQDIQIFAAQVATAIAGWTVIGVPIVQACVTLAIAAAESAYDLVLLHQGKDVAIYKNSTTFVCSPTGMVSKIGKEIAIEMIEEAAEKTAEAIDNKIDEISNMANDKIEEKRQAAVDYVAEYTKEQANQINTTVANMSVVPLMNALMPIATDFDNTANATVDQIKEDLEKAVDAAFEAITKSISDMPDDSIVGTVAGYVYTEELKDKLKAEVIKHFNENVNPENYSAVDKLYSLKDYLIDDEIGESEPNGVISKAIYNKKTDIDGLFAKKSEELTKKITDLKDEQIGNLKNVLHEGIDDMSSKITGTVTESLEGAAENLKLDKVKDASASTGFTLNYKEYCKIFVLVKLAAGQEPKMLNRAAALIEANVKTANGVNNPEFQIINAYTLVSIKSKVRMGTLFPWGVSVEDASGTTGSVDLSLDMESFGENFVTINYQAVNGY